jgi:FixJ family two-component response regulator
VNNVSTCDTKSPPTIAYPDDAVRARALDAGAVCFLHKPFEGQSLIQCIYNALDSRGGKMKTD